MYNGDLSSRDFLVSIKPRFANAILDGRKTVELRRRFPTKFAPSTKLFIYSSTPVCAIIGCTRIERVLHLRVSNLWRKLGSEACISKTEFERYFNGIDYGYAIVLTKAVRFANSLALAELKRSFGIIPPQSFRYISFTDSTAMSDGAIQIPHRHKRGYRARRRSPD